MSEAQEPAVDLANKEQVTARAMTKKQRERRNDEDLDFIMSSKQGRRFMARLLSASPFNELSYREGTEGLAMTLGMTFREGRRSMCADLIVDVIRVCPASYGLMMTESNEGT